MPNKSSFLPKVLATAFGIAAYELALRPLVADRGRRNEPSDADEEFPDDDFLSEDWEDEG